MRKEGLTLTELLTVLAIVGLLVLLLLPIILQVRKRSYEPVCISNLRQLSVAFHNYRHDFGAEPNQQRQLWRYVSDTRILVCPADPTQDGAATIESNHPNTPPKQLIKTSYLYFGDALFYSEKAVEKLRSQDPNHGIFVCFAHGEPLYSHVHVPRHEMKGKILRLRIDGSVQRARAEFTCFSRDGVVYGYRLGWQLFIDVRPVPAEVIEEHPLLEGTQVECPPPFR